MVFARLARGIGGAGKWLVTTAPGVWTLTGTGIGCYYAQQEYGTAKNWYKSSFKVVPGKDPDAISDFYSTEDFLQILGIFPPVIHLILSGVEWKNDREQVMDVHNMMQISFDITEKEDVIDGKTVTTFFNKRERFIQYIPYTEILLWDQIQNYGYRRSKDGTLTVEHHGEFFHGPFPIRFLCLAHAQYVAWATEKHINSPIFGTEDLENQEEQRGNIPLHVFHQWLDKVKEEQQLKIGNSTGKEAEDAKAAVAKINRLKRTQSVVQVKSLKRTASVAFTTTKDGEDVSRPMAERIKLSSDDPEAQAAIKEALEHINSTDPSAQASLQKLLAGKEVQWQK